MRRSIARCAARSLAIVSAIAATCVVGGCAEPKYPVMGKVVYADDGTPAGAGAVILFESTTAPFPRAMGAIAPDGTFQLSSDRAQDGALAGEHRVSVVPRSSDASARDMTVELSRKIDPKFFELRTSGVTATIQPTGRNDFTIAVDRPPKSPAP